ncbi:MAG: 6-phosphogluconolactonase [Chitinophagaceae bacterium]
MPIHIYKNTDDLNKAVCEWMTGYINSTLEKNGRFTIALSGGSTPKKLHTLLAASPFKEKIDWGKMHFFWGDERAVPFTDERNNAKMAFDTLLNLVPISANQVHIMRTDITPEDSAAAYEGILHGYFDETATTFDLVLLGMGDDGHTLSLFPGTEIIHEQNAWTKAFLLTSQNMYRISLTAPVVNKAACVAFLATGSKKAGTLKQVLYGDYLPDIYPSQLIKPNNGEAHWFIDEDAASELDKPT